MKFDCSICPGFPSLPEGLCTVNGKGSYERIEPSFFLLLPFLSLLLTGAKWTWYIIQPDTMDGSGLSEDMTEDKSEEKLLILNFSLTHMFSKGKAANKHGKEIVACGCHG